MINKKIPLQQLKHTTQRYIDCLSNDFPNITNKPIKRSLNNVAASKKLIGIAPFAAHKSKVWPLEKYLPIISKFNDYKFIIFAFGKDETRTAKEKLIKPPNCQLIKENISIDDQLDLINQMDLFITMDSANMHLGCQTNTKVISIWGPTHPYTGFGPLFNEDHIIQISVDQMPCRPCSIYGKIKQKDKNCAYESMRGISSTQLIKKMEECLS